MQRAKRHQNKTLLMSQIIVIVKGVIYFGRKFSWNKNFAYNNYLSEFMS